MKRQRIRWLIVLLVSMAVSIAVSMAHFLTGSLRLEGYAAYQPNQPSPTVTPPIAFPSDYRQQFVQYATVNCPNSRIVRKMYVNSDSLETIATSQTIPSETIIVMETHSANLADDDRLVPHQLNNVFIRQKRTGWNVEANSGEWQSAWYSPSGALVSDNQSSCISCHAMVRDRDYVFTLPALLTAAQTKQLQTQQTEFGTSVCR